RSDGDRRAALGEDFYGREADARVAAGDEKAASTQVIAHRARRESDGAAGERVEVRLLVARLAGLVHGHAADDAVLVDDEGAALRDTERVHVHVVLLGDVA